MGNVKIDKYLSLINILAKENESIATVLSYGLQWSEMYTMSDYGLNYLVVPTRNKYCVIVIDEVKEGYVEVYASGATNISILVPVDDDGIRKMHQQVVPNLSDELRRHVFLQNDRRSIQLIVKSLTSEFVDFDMKIYDILCIFEQIIFEINEYFADFPGRFQATISIGVWMVKGSSGSVYLNSDVIKKMSKLKLELDLGIYQVGGKGPPASRGRGPV